METILITGEHLTMEDVARGSSGGRPVSLAPQAVPGDGALRGRGVLKLLERGEIAYGITTGFGAFKGRIIPPP